MVVFQMDFIIIMTMMGIISLPGIVVNNAIVLVDYTEPDNVQRLPDMAERKLSSGTIALQGHDPKSIVYYRNIQVKPLD